MSSNNFNNKNGFLYLAKKNIAKLSPKLAQLFVHSKYSILTMADTVALRSLIPNFYEQIATDLRLILVCRSRN